MSLSYTSPNTYAPDIADRQLYKEDVLARARTFFELPLLELVFQAQKVHRLNHDPEVIQFCTLSSIKTGACPEDCAYCPQSSRYKTSSPVHNVLDIEEVKNQAAQAEANGSTRFCLGAAWRDLPQGKTFEGILELIEALKTYNLEICCTLGMLNHDQAKRLKESGLHTYNHNIDTSPEFYPEIITTRKYQERLDTIANIQAAGIKVCSGGIIGMGESSEDRLRFLAVLASLEPNYPDSVPINALVPMEGTPLAKRPLIDPLELVRMVAVARLLMPKAMVRLSAGRKFLSDEAQALCFLAGANSIHTGEKLLTTPNAGEAQDHKLMLKLGLKIMSQG
ncbi:MAG: biotin synthase BioB [Candidatus Caenarcaniphilales bacterium]|nr:biotin synthase BioB [Candidatus Caenarcaniphilales bacterium]